MTAASWGTYVPLLLLLFAYLLVQLATPIVVARNPEGRERMQAFGFLVVLVAAGYAVLLVIIALVSVPGLVVDALEIIFVVVASFGILLVVLFAIFELILSRGSRRRTPRT